MSFKSKWALPVSIIVVVAMIIIYLKASQPAPPTVASEEKSWLVNVEEVTISSHAPDLSLLGTVVSPFDAQLSTSIVADVAAVHVRDGDKVLKGQALVSLDTSEIASLVAQRQADLAEAKALIDSEFTRAEADKKSLKEEQRLYKVAREALARQAKLKSSNLIAQERLEQSESEVAQRALSITSREQAIADHPARLAQLNARKARAEALLGDANRDLEKSTIRAPFNGTVTATMVSPGDRVQVGQNVVSLFDNQQIEVQAQLPDKYLSQIRRALDANKDIYAESLYLGEAIRLKLLRLSGASNARSGAIDAYFAPIEPQGMILNTTLKLVTELPSIKHSFTLPPSAIYGNDRVYKVQESRLEAVPAKILGQQITIDGKTRIIVDADKFTNSEQIITTQLPNAISGLKVEIRNADAIKTDAL